MSQALLNRRDFIKALGLAAAGHITAGCSNNLNIFHRRTPPAQPNFVFILIDDMGWRDTGCYGSSFYETPNIDALARGSMFFTNAYAASPVCSPTRASILTGKHPARLRLTNFLSGMRNGKLNPADYVRQMPLEEITIAEALKQAGYITALVGKWHLGSAPFYPQHQGFDINIAGSDMGMAPTHFYPYKNPDQTPSIPEFLDGKPGEYLADRLTDEAVKFIEANRDKSFFLYLSHYAVHTPLEAKDSIAAKYEKKAACLPPTATPRFRDCDGFKVRQVQDHAVYAAMVESVDDSVERIMRTLDRLNLADNTVIIFTSDNGGLATSEGWPTANLPLRAGKGWLYEGGIREPLLIKWPGVTKPGSICNTPVISTDFYPTMLEMAKLAPKPRQHCDGLSLVPLLKNTGPLDRDILYWHYPHYSNQFGPPCGAIRAGDYKLIEFFEDGRTELYNLADDIGEIRNLSAASPQKNAELLEKLHAWRTALNAAMPTPNPDYKAMP